MSGCRKCEVNERIIGILNEQSERYRHDAELWRRNRYYVQKALREIYQISKEAMWHPSSFETRGEDGVTDQEKRWCGVQFDRPHMEPSE